METNILKINLRDYINYPAHPGDAGYDIIAASKPKIIGKEVAQNYFESIDYIEYDTNLIIAPDAGVHTLVLPRSSISKTNLLLANSVGLIDNGYRGTIKVRFKYIYQPKDLTIVNEGQGIFVEVDENKIYKQGERIGQLVFAKTITPKIEEIGSFVETSRKEGGFGSTGS
jgi:dUTP pyrophosphatase